MSMLTQPMGVGEKLSFLYMDAYDAFGNPHPENRRGALIWQDAKNWQVKSGYLIAAWKDEYLIFDRDLGELVLEKKGLEH